MPEQWCAKSIDQWSISARNDSKRSCKSDPTRLNPNSLAAALMMPWSELPARAFAIILSIRRRHAGRNLHGGTTQAKQLPANPEQFTSPLRIYSEFRHP
jgi:hypothetical protein